MAEQAADEDANAYLRGRMSIEEQGATYRAFDGLVRFGSLGIAALLLLLVLLFCTPMGVFPSLVVAAILMAAGVGFLRKAPPSVDTL